MRGARRFEEWTVSAGRNVAVLGLVDLREVDGRVVVLLVPSPDGPVVVDAPG